MTDDEQTKCIKTYIKLLLDQDQYELDGEHLLNIWVQHKSGLTPDTKPATKIPATISSDSLEVSTTTYTHTELSKLKKPNLQELCKLHHLPHSGVKSVLIQRLLNRNNQVTFKRNTSNTCKKSSVSKTSISSILTKIENNKDYIQIRRNIYGNYEHLDTGLIFNQNTQEVIGKQDDGGIVKQLKLADIETCTAYNFKYVLPENLANSAPTVFDNDEEKRPDDE